MAKKIKLNVGCGKDYRNGWVNLDALAELQPDIVHDLLQPLPFKDGQVSRVLAQDILEHFTKEDGRSVMSEVARVLEDGGIATFRVPHIDSILHKYSDDHEVRNEFLYGTTKDTGEFGAHKVGFSQLSFLELCISSNLVPTGFSIVDTNMEVTCVKKQVVPKTMKLLFFVHTFGMGGAEQFCIDLAVTLQRKNFQLTVASNHEPFLLACKNSSIDTFRQNTSIDIIGDWKGLAKSLVLAPVSLFEYFKCIRKVKPDLLVAVGFSDKFFVSFLSWLLAIPLLWVEFGPLDTVLKKFQSLPKLLYFLVKGLPQKVVVPSQHTLQKLTVGARVSLGKIERVPCGTIAPEQKKLTTKKMILCVSRFAKDKGQDLLLEAYAQNKKVLQDYSLTFIGVGETLERCKKRASDLGIAKQVAFLGWVEDSGKMVSKAAFCVFPSTWDLEGFGLVTIEAMAYAKPVIAFAVGPSPEIISHQKTGLLVRERTSQALGEAIVYLATNPLVAKKMGTLARDAVVTKYDIQKVADEYAAVIKRCYSQSLAQVYIDSV